eukprot:scaffold108638_cov39-Prasinocladus_malaysianus.AAC.2
MLMWPAAGYASASNAASILEAFWGDAKVVSADQDQGGGKFTVQYEAPTLRAKVGPPNITSEPLCGPPHCAQ